MPMISMKATILVPITLVGISLHFLRPLQGWIILDLHKNLLKWYSMGYTVDSALKGQASYYLSLSFLPPVLSLDEGPTRNDD